MGSSLIACRGAGSGRFGYSHHPYTDGQLHRLLGDYPNPGANIDSFVRDASGNKVTPPKDHGAYAIELVELIPGHPAAMEGSDPKEVLGEPDYTANIWEPSHALSLGNGGVLVVRLTGYPLLDQPGPDLFVFEVGPSHEAVLVDISEDGQTWIFVGEAPGGAFAMDIAPFVKPEQAFRYIRLRDIPNTGVGDSGPWTGAEIDAIAAVRGTPKPPVEKPPERISIPTEVLFGFDSDELSEGAPTELDRIVAMVRSRGAGKLSIEGHTDDVGDDAYNLALSERRAQAVRAYFASHGLDASTINARGLGEAHPIAPNDSDEGRAKNRRVEILLSF